MKKTSGFAQGALILMVASGVTKIIGAIFKIPLTNLVGADGMGVFSVAYTIYTTLFIISTAGLPVAISKMVAEANARGKYGQVRAIFKVSMLSFSLVGTVASIALILFADDFTRLVGNTLAYYAVLAIAPSLFFVSLVSIIRGYFQGLSNMVPTAISQVLESVGKLAFGSLFAFLLIKNGYPVEIAAAGAIFGVTLGMGISALYLVICNRKQLKETPTGVQDLPNSKILSQLIKIAIPVTVGSAVLSLTNLIDMFFVMNRLQSAAGFTEMEANKLYGAYNMAVSMFNLPQTFVVAIAVSIIPAIAAYLAKGNRAKAMGTISSSLRISTILAFPAGIGLFILAEPILKLVYFNKPVDAQIAVPLMTLLGLAVICVALVSLSNSILQSSGHVNVPVITMLIGGIIKIVANYTLVGNPEINIKGAPIGTLLCYGSIAIMNLVVIKAKFPELSYIKTFIKPFLSAVIMGAFAYFLSPVFAQILGAKLGVLAVIGVSGVIYCVVLFISGGLPKEDVLMLPKGDAIARKLRMK